MAAIVIPVIFIPVKRHRNTCWRNCYYRSKDLQRGKNSFF
ncbi:hypothetical protein BLAHAN_04798 [Blautia hansenii DSM 20583]|uniref:Uncharacterized protein n=1 Tax=Blautia hansenii DSM 20583 TaxID=537007 RepID=C9L5Z1_BLAHA|nr:hypothetical protein BLAHAN_04798 [Blautia hansenii DSM 20583]